MIRRLTIALALILAAAISPLAVAQSTTGGAFVSWTPPTTTNVGTPLTDLAGFNVYYGANPSALTNRVNIPNVSATGYAVTGLAPGTWYFVVTSYTAQGTESVPSNAVPATVVAGVDPGAPSGQPNTVTITIT